MGTFLKPFERIWFIFKHISGLWWGASLHCEGSFVERWSEVRLWSSTVDATRSVTKDCRNEEMESSPSAYSHETMSEIRLCSSALKATRSMA